MDDIIKLIDEYIWVTHGSDPNDDYRLSDEDDYDKFLSELEDKIRKIGDARVEQPRVQVQRRL